MSRQRRFPLNLPDNLHTAVRARAATVGLTTTAWIVAVIEHALRDQPVTTTTKEQQL